MLPSVIELPQDAGCAASFLQDAAGHSAMLFSSQNPLVVDKHVEWVAQYGISGLAVQSFVELLKNHPDAKKAKDVVIQNIRMSSEKYGRVFFMTYDISGAGPDWPELVEKDWDSLADNGTLESPSYLREKGHPIIQIWGLGFAGRPVSPSDLQRTIDHFKNGQHQATVLLGVPGRWRYSEAWLDVFKSASAISPWRVGMYHSSEEAIQFDRTVMVDDIKYARENNLLYMPVIFPGYSAYNGSHGREALDAVPRHCGAFMKTQVEEITRRGVNTVYVAMFDEANEGTAIFKTMPSQPSYTSQILSPEGPCDRDGDLYLKIAGALARKLQLH